MQAEVVAMATDLAEFIGGAIGIALLFPAIPLFTAGIITAFAAFGVVSLRSRGLRGFAGVITVLVGVIVAAFVFEVILARPSVGAVAAGLVTPRFSGTESVLLGAGILGATVMPHVIDVRSALKQRRVVGATEEEQKKIFNFEKWDVISAMGLAGLINVAMLTIAAAALNAHHVTVPNLDAAFRALGHTLDHGADIFFGLGLLASGLSSSSVGTLAAQVVIHAFIHPPIPLFLPLPIPIRPAAHPRQVPAPAAAPGYAPTWSAEAYGCDAASVLAWWAAGRSRIKLGAGIFQIPARSAAMTAMTAATIDQLSGGRMLLGLGTSGPQVSEGWHGVRFPHQVERTRDYVAVVRIALAHKKVEYHGETLDLPLPDGRAKVLKLTIRPVQANIPIYLAVLGPKNVALAGEIADGWLPVFFSPEHVSRLRVPLEEGAARRRRPLDDFRICPQVNVLISDDIAVARDAMRPVLALYIGGMGSREQNFYNRLVSSYGFEDAAREVQDLYLTGQKAAAMEALPDELIH